MGEKTTQQYNKYASALLLIIFLIIASVPFHAFFTTWAGSNLGAVLLWRGWKEALVFVGVLIGVYLLIRDRTLRTRFFSDRLNQVIIVFSLLMLVTSMILVKDGQALLLGLTIQLRLFVIFMLAQITAFYKPPTRRQLMLLVMVPAAFVVVFGLLQQFVLPINFLTYFGYQKGVTIPPYFTIDDQITKLRIFSTLRGPNPLGVYLILPILVVGAWLGAHVRRKNAKAIFLGVVFLLALLTVLYGSHSRSAWLGLVAALTTYALLSASKKMRIILFSLFLVLSTITGVAVYQLRNQTFVQDVILHDNPVEGGDISSNEGHLDAIVEGVEDIRERPLVGCGAGCAGPASFHNNGGAKISENYFVQTAQESGLIGLSLLIVIFVVISVRLFWNKDPFARTLLAVLVGVSVASMLSHAWADDTIAYIWWALAGLVVYNGATTKQKQHTHGTEKTKIASNSAS